MDWSETRSMEMGCWRDVGGTSVLKRGSECTSFVDFGAREGFFRKNGFFGDFLFDTGLAVSEAKAKGGGSFNTEKQQALWLSSEDFVSNLGPHFCSSRASPLEFEGLLGRGVVDRSSKSSFFNASLAHGHGAPFGSLLHK